MKLYLVLAAALAWTAPCSALKLVSLRCEGVVDPLAVQTGQPGLSWLLEADRASQTDLAQSAYRVIVASSRRLAEAGRGDVWDSGKVASRDTIQIQYMGQPLASGEEYFWTVQVWDQAGQPSARSGVTTFRMGLLRPEDWKARWISGPPAEMSMPVFRRVVRFDKKIRRAIVYISGLGQYELQIRGRKIGNAVLAPGWTDYRKTILYNAYDVTSALTTGDNDIGVMLGNGFFDVPGIPGRYTKLVESFGRPMMIAQIHVVFTDGSSTDVVSDTSWKTRAGPITTSHQYGGEDYDARLESDRDWQSALTATPPGGRLVAQLSPDIRVMETFRTQSVKEPGPGVRIYDLGQNFSGWPRITVRGPAGATVKMFPAELLNPEGLVLQHNSGSPVWFSYTLKGSGSETWSPRFSYYGFRYLQVETTGAEVTSVEGQFVHSSAPVTGEFSCSNDLFNRIHKLIDMAIVSNMQSVLTDCPHREKLLTEWYKVSRKAEWTRLEDVRKDFRSVDQVGEALVFARRLERSPTDHHRRVSDEEDLCESLDEP